ncbi:hypothetical protein COCMIDRAFT_37107 [Bipolaris oryzae ATCC 44560]|uniref:Uncharacterized protein n=1 Tax=Bipolaris oryzae ATCC 44560 TaxID=930090 RepID=W6Z585_COCMI|nr:uncharacterized protein COCMIDRAFT_37107 [Bipolaris oryzae ATCC 44560]EUC45145.1 hypothetical protein COCMIDRAFT_37107 [Bipolaris oryzae ATCC 44560]
MSEVQWECLVLTCHVHWSFTRLKNECKKRLRVLVRRADYPSHPLLPPSPRTLPHPPLQKAKSTSKSPPPTRLPPTAMKSTKTSQPAVPLPATPTAATPPGTATPTYTTSQDHEGRKQQILKRLEIIHNKVASRSKVFIDASHKHYRMCLKREYKPYVDLDPEVNLAMLYITCERERQTLDEVIKMQLEVGRRARLLEEAVAEEKRLDAEFWELVNKNKKG